MPRSKRRITGGSCSAYRPAEIVMCPTGYWQLGGSDGPNMLVMTPALVRDYRTHLRPNLNRFCFALSVWCRHSSLGVRLVRLATIYMRRFSHIMLNLHYMWNCWFTWSTFCGLKSMHFNLYRRFWRVFQQIWVARTYKEGRRVKISMNFQGSLSLTYTLNSILYNESL